MERVGLFWYVRPLPVAACLRLRWQGGTATERNARVLAEALCRKDGRRVFGDMREVLKLGEGCIERLAGRWLAMSLRENPPPTAERVSRRMEALRGDGLGRLAGMLGIWKIPVYDWELTELAAGILLEEERILAGLCPNCRVAAEAGNCLYCGETVPVMERNEGFDETAFLALKEGRGHD